MVGLRTERRGRVDSAVAIKVQWTDVRLDGTKRRSGQRARNARFVGRKEKRQRGCSAMRPLPGEEGTMGTGRTGGVCVGATLDTRRVSAGRAKTGLEGNRRHGKPRGPWQVLGVWDRGDHELIRPGAPDRE